MAKELRTRELLHVKSSDKQTVHISRDFSYSENEYGKVDIDVTLKNEAVDYILTQGDHGEISAMMESFAIELANKIKSWSQFQIDFNKEKETIDVEN